MYFSKAQMKKLCCWWTWLIISGITRLFAFFTAKKYLPEFSQQQFLEKLFYALKMLLSTCFSKESGFFWQENEVLLKMLVKIGIRNYLLCKTVLAVPLCFWNLWSTMMDDKKLKCELQKYRSIYPDTYTWVGRR